MWFDINYFLSHYSLSVHKHFVLVDDIFIEHWTLNKTYIKQWWHKFLNNQQANVVI